MVEVRSKEELWKDVRQLVVQIKYDVNLLTASADFEDLYARLTRVQARTGEALRLLDIIWVLKYAE